MAQEMTQAATSWDEMEVVSDGEADGGSEAGSLGEAELNLLGEAAAAIVTQQVVHVDRFHDMFWFRDGFMSDVQLVLPLFDDRSESAGHIGVQIRIATEVVPKDEELVRWTEWPVMAEQPSGLAYSRRMETQGRVHTRRMQQWKWREHTEVGNVRVKMARFGELRVIMARQTRLLSPAGTGAGQHRVISALVRVTKNEMPMVSVDLLKFMEQARVYEVRTLDGGMLFEVAVTRLGPSRPRSAAEGTASFEHFAVPATTAENLKRIVALFFRQVRAQDRELAAAAAARAALARIVAATVAAVARASAARASESAESAETTE
jgi:hypothetical protein